MERYNACIRLHSQPFSLILVKGISNMAAGELAKEAHYFMLHVHLEQDVLWNNAL